MAVRLNAGPVTVVITARLVRFRLRLAVAAVDVPVVVGHLSVVGHRRRQPVVQRARRLTREAVSAPPRVENLRVGPRRMQGDAVGHRAAHRAPPPRASVRERERPLARHPSHRLSVGAVFPREIVHPESGPGDVRPERRVVRGGSPSAAHRAGGEERGYAAVVRAEHAAEDLVKNLVRELGDAGARGRDGRIARMLLFSSLLLLLFDGDFARPRARRVPPLSLHRDRRRRHFPRTRREGRRPARDTPRIATPLAPGVTRTGPPILGRGRVSSLSSRPNRTDKAH